MVKSRHGDVIDLSSRQRGGAWDHCWIAPGWISTTLKIDEGVRGGLGEPAWTGQGARKRGFPGVASPFWDHRVMESGT
jgi:hypothetical protein